MEPLLMGWLGATKFNGGSLSCSVTLEKGTLFWAWTIFSGAATQKKVGKRIGLGATEPLSS